MLHLNVNPNAVLNPSSLATPKGTGVVHWLGACNAKAGRVSGTAEQVLAKTQRRVGHHITALAHIHIPAYTRTMYKHGCMRVKLSSLSPGLQP